jgi:hypothetical protein
MKLQEWNYFMSTGIPQTNEWHTNPDYIIHELEEAITLLEKSLLAFAMQNTVSLD